MEYPRKVDVDRRKAIAGWLVQALESDEGATGSGSGV